MLAAWLMPVWLMPVWLVPVWLVPVWLKPPGENGGFTLPGLESCAKAAPPGVGVIPGPAMFFGELWHPPPNITKRAALVPNPKAALYAMAVLLIGTALSQAESLAYGTKRANSSDTSDLGQCQHRISTLLGRGCRRRGQILAFRSGAAVGEVDSNRFARNALAAWERRGRRPALDLLLKKRLSTISILRSAVLS